MEYEQFIKKELKKAETEKQQAFLKYNERKKELKDMKAAMAFNDFPESTGVLENLEAHIGKPVIIEENYSAPTKENLNYDPELHRVVIGGGWSTHIMGDSIKRIIDAETGKTIFENPYGKNLDPLKVAKIFGMKQGLKELENCIDSNERSKKWAQETYEETKKALENIPTWIQRGKNLVYPEKFDKWVECVCYRASGLYHGLELVNAIEVMEALDSGMNLHQVKNVISDNHSGASYGMLVKIVTNFSKRGPEFFREYSSSYQYDLINGKSEEIREAQEWLSQLEKENALYEKNNSKHQPQPNE